MFTKQQIIEIRDKLALFSVKDSQFDNATLPLSGKEYVALVQNNLSVKTPVSSIQDLVTAKLPKVVVGSAYNWPEVINFMNDSTNLYLAYWQTVYPLTEQKNKIIVPKVNKYTPGILASSDYSKFIDYGTTLDNHTSTLTGYNIRITANTNNIATLVGRCNTIDGTAKAALTLGQNLESKIIPPVQSTANEAKALANVNRGLIDTINGNISKLFELNVVYPSSLQDLTTSSTEEEIISAFTPMIGGTTAVVNTPHVGYLIQTSNSSKPDCLIICVELGSVTTSSGVTVTTHKILYLKNNSDLYRLEVSLNKDNYFVHSVTYFGALTAWRQRFEYISSQIERHEDKIIDAMTAINTANNNIATNTTNIAANTTTITSHTNAIKDLEDTSVAMGKQVDSNTEEIGVLDNEFNTFGQDFDALKSEVSTINDRATALEEKTPTMWINILATKDTAVMVNGERVELPAYTNVVVKDVETFALADNTPNPKCITRFDVHYNGIFPISKWRLSQNYQPTDETTVKWYGCSSLTTIDVSCLDTSKWTNSLTHTFEGCTSLQFLDVSGWDTSKMQYLDYMFCNCTSLQSLDVSGWDTSNVSEMFATFAACTLLQALDLSKWDTRKVTNANTMFSDCFSLTDITFGEGFGKAVASLTIDLSYCGRGEGYVLTDNTYNSMLTMYDRAANGLSTMTIKFNAKHNIPDGFIAAMTAKGYTITQ